MVDVSILEYLAGVGAGAGAEIALEEAIRRARRLVPGYQRRSSPVGRLLTLLHYEFGARAGLSQDDFDDWRDDVDLDAALKEVVSGKAIGPGELAKRITPRLEGVVDGLGLAEQIADAAITLAPLAQREIPEQTSFLSNQTKAGVAALSEQSRAETKQVLGKTQQILAALDQGLEDSGPTAALGRALLLGPLDLVGARRSAEQAEVAKESDPGAAAQLLGEVSKRMGEAGLEPFAEIYAAKAAESHVKAGEVDKAVALFEKAAFGQVHRASSFAWITIGSFERAAPAEEKWRAAALAATLNWVGDPGGAVADLTTAIDRSKNDPRWAVELVDVLVLIEDWSALLKLGAELPTGLSAPQEARFRLGRVEARSALGDNGAEAEWDELLLWAEQQGPDISGVAWQRRAMRLALDDRAEEAREAYRGAMERWLSPDGQYADQLADAFYGGVAVETNAGMRTESAEFMPLAAELRGPAMTPAPRIEMRLSAAMRQLLGERFREGFFSTGQALRLARLSGSLFSTLEAMELMGRLLEAADHSDAALFYYVRAGKGKEATRVSRSLAPQDVCDALDIRGPGWVRTASYLVLKEMAGSVPEDWVAEHLELMLGDAEGPPPPSIFLTPTVAARTAISAIALQVPVDQRPLVLEIVEQEFRTAMPEGRGIAGRALVLGTAAGLWDYTELAIDGFLVEPQLSGVDVRWVAERASEDHAALQQLIAAAKDGSKPALEALSLIDPVPEDPDLRALATKELGGGSLKSVKREKNQVSVGMMRIAQLGALATFVVTEAVADLVERLLALTDDGEEPESHRTSAVHALFNLIPVLDHSQLASVVEALTPLAEGKYEPAPFDHEHTDDPLAFLRLNLHEENALRAAALQAIGRAEAKLGVETTIGAAILEALQSRNSTLVRGGLDAASYVAGGFDPAWIVARLDDPDVGVRLAAVRALVDREALDQGLVERILSDQVAAVRQPLLHIKGPLDLRTFVRDRMATDPDAYLRALARLP